MRLIYHCLFFVFALLYLPVFLLKGKHRRGLSERFGRISEEIRQRLQGQEVFWIHAVSVGEVSMAIRFASALRARRAQAHVVLTTTTVAGWEVAQKTKDAQDTLLCAPIDFQFAVRSFIDALSPRAVVILETEIWPNLIMELSRRGIPVTIINGRLSDRGIASYRRIRFFLRGILARLHAVGAQDERMRQRFIELGAPEQRVFVTGNLKYDWAPRSQPGDLTETTTALLRKESAFWLVAGSTHENEEEMIFAKYHSVKREIPSLRILVAPRHLQRMAQIQAKAAQYQIRLVGVSTLSEASSAQVDKDSVLVLDQMGVLSSWYRLADVVFVGGSLVPVGGHNLVEPAYYEKPILFGPSMHNFAPMAAEFQKQGAANQVSGPDDLFARLVWLYKHQEERARMGSSAKRLLLAHQGAIQKNMDLVWEGLSS